MAKRKHPTIKSLRQGQTVYAIMGRSMVLGCMLSSDKVQSHHDLAYHLSHTRISAMRECVEFRENAKYYYYSKKKACSALKALIAE